ncbi:hypothetical protein [Marispirochaeta aestuarii]|uniref:hypothetical protein n=1 Tax=Marispirochaeta aestuarii TaxID=1963862 RepID=UPI0029C8B15D|nr:hypothetical protein [Marispirochaeta aestuarii]
MATKALDLFQAYAEDKLPRDGGYIVSSFFDQNSAYSKYEVVAYNGVKNIYLSEEGLTFQTDGNKLFVLVEPTNYPEKHVEPYVRKMAYQIPHRFNELEIFTAKNQTKVMVSKIPTMTYSSFTILRPTGINFSLLIFNTPDVLNTMEYFFTETINKEAGVPKSDAKKAAAYIVEGIKKFSIF